MVRYEWDLDGNGSFETDSGSSPTTSRSYSTPGPVDTRLRVTDDDGGTDTATRTIHVGTTPPTASFTVAPNPAQTGETVSFNGSGSSDPDGSVVRYEWDLDGNGSFETDTGATPTTTHAYASTGNVDVRLRVTDDDGATAQTTRTVTIEGGGLTYSQVILATPGLTSYWRLDETSGAVFADSKGGRHATAHGPTGGAPGALLGSGDQNPGASFDGVDDYADAAVDLSATPRVTVEFWLKWNAFTSNDDLALEFTPNFNGNDGGILVDPNAPEEGGRFAVAIGRGASRNNAYFVRPSGGQWHHYAFVLDTTLPAGQQVKPYVDGQPVSYVKTVSGTGAGNFANSTLYFMSRGGAGLFGGGTLDELAIYERALPDASVLDHYTRGSGP